MMALALITACAVLYYFFRTVFNWRTQLWPGLTAIVLLLLAPVFGPVLGATLRSAAFAHDLPRYNELAAWATKQALPGQEIRLTAPARYADLGSVIFVRQSSQCGTTADISWAGAFPVLRWQRRYASMPKSQSVQACREAPVVLWRDAGAPEIRQLRVTVSELLWLTEACFFARQLAKQLDVDQAVIHFLEKAPCHGGLRHRSQQAQIQLV